MIRRIPLANWHIALANAIKNSNDDDIIVVHSKAMHELAASTKARMCPSKQISFVIEMDDDVQEDNTWRYK